MPPNEDNSHYEKILATGEVKCIDDEIPFEIPKSWEWCRLGNITTIIGGYAFPSNSIKSSNGIRVIRISDFNNGKILEHKGVMYNGSLDLSQYQIFEKDILMAMTGGTVGKCVLLPQKVKEPMLLNQRVALIRNFYVYEKYIYTILISNITQEVVNTQKNSTNDNISMEDIYKFLIPLPSLSEQQRIVERLEMLLPLIEQYSKAYLKLETLNREINNHLKKSILQYAIQGNLVAQCDTDEPATVLLERIREEKKKLVASGKLKKKDLTDSTIFKGDDNKYYEKCDNTITCIDAEIPFEIPKSWSWCRLSTLMQILTGKKDANYGDEKGSYEFFTCSNTPLKSTTYSYDGDYLIMPGNGANIGQVIHYTGRFEAYQRTYLLHAYSLINLDYLKYHLMCNWKEYNQDKLYGSAIPYIKLGNLTSYLVALPPLVEQQRIVDKIEQSLASIMSR